MILPYQYFVDVFNRKLFEDSYSDLLKKIAQNPERYIGLFRPTKPRTKLIQNITQSHEIRFGDALETIFEEYFRSTGFEVLQKRFVYNNKELNVDQLIRKNNEIYLIEQKVRDDHDSSKKVGQFDNFERKYHAISQMYPHCDIIPIMWFIDDSLVKNMNYYLVQMESMGNDYLCSPKLFYGEDMFTKIDCFSIDIWKEVICYLERWKNTLPDMPEVNFDINADDVFNEIKGLEPIVYRKLFTNNNIVSQIFPIIFPEGTVLRKLLLYFQISKGPSVYNSIVSYINQILDKNYVKQNYSIEHFPSVKYSSDSYDERVLLQ